MILVVLVHVHHKNYLQLDWDLSGPVTQAWSALNTVLTPMRVPLFFTISGMLAASAIARPWRSVVRPRVALPAYLYVLWITFAVGLYALIGSSIDDLNVKSVFDYLALLIVPSSTLWYLYALAVYFVVAKLAHSLPTWAPLAAAGVLSVIAYAFFGDGTPARVSQNLVFFLVGAYLPEIVKGVAARASTRLALVAAGVYVVVLAIYVLELDGIPGARTVAALIAVWCGITIIAVLAKWPVFAETVGYVGKNTLPIYVLHVPLLALFACLTAGLFGGTSLVLAVVYPPLVMIGLIVTALLLRWALVQARASWLFSLPNPKVREIGKVSA